MKTAHLTFRSIIAVTMVVASTSAFAQEPTPGYNYPIPAKVMTPDRVETRIGTLRFFDGRPHDETVAKLYDNLLHIRGVETFLNGIPATSIEGLRLGHLDLGVDASHKVIVFDKLADSAPLFPTANTDTVYASTFLDLEKGSFRRICG